MEAQTQTPSPSTPVFRKSAVRVFSTRSSFIRPSYMRLPFAQPSTNRSILARLFSILSESARSSFIRLSSKPLPYTRLVSTRSTPSRRFSFYHPLCDHSPSNPHNPRNPSPMIFTVCSFYRHHVKPWLPSWRNTFRRGHGGRG